MSCKRPLGPLLIGLLLAGCHHLAPAPRAVPGAPGDEVLVRATLLPAADAIAPGGTLLLGARLQIAPGWHIYWQNPGDSGLPTRLVVQAPPGFQAGPTRYPGPEAFTAPGPVRSYGYQRETALFAELTAPAAPAAGSVPVRARVSWLACRESCVPGSAELAIELPVAPSPRAVSAALLDPHRRLLPLPLAEAPGEVRLSTAGPALRIEAPWAQGLGFFPDAGWTARPLDERPGALAVEVRSEGAAAAALTGLVSARRGSELRYYSIQTPINLAKETP